MNINSNRYIFIYAVIIVVVVAVILSVAATMLAPKQEENIRIEKMQNILRAAMADQNTTITAKNTLSLYDSYIIQEITLNNKGDVLNVFDVKTGTFTEGSGLRAFEIDIKEQLENLQKGKDAQLPVFVYQNNHQKKYVIPLRGIGLWGAIWGNLALSEDLQRIQGAVFDHKGETPGLGAEITNTTFSAQFQEKMIFEKAENIQPFRIVKGGISTLSETERAHAVDALSGATITSEGVQKMINNFIEYYKPWILNTVQKNDTLQHPLLKIDTTHENNIYHE
jgi:Na+-transporting NADH:ubiquinone oxidoreductase subunit C